VTPHALPALVAAALAFAGRRAEQQPPQVDASEALLADLEQDEEAWRAATDWASFPASDATLGPDPYDITALPDGRFAGVLRGANAVVLLDAGGRELARAPGPRAACSLDAAGDEVFVAGELDGSIWESRVDGRGFTMSGVRRAVPGRSGLRGIAVGRGIHAVDVDGQLCSIPDGLGNHGWDGESVGGAALAPEVAGGWRAATSVLAHRVIVERLDDHGHARQVGRAVISADGPLLGTALRAVGVEALVAIGLIEDHPLDRTGGSFGFIDSFLRVVRVSARGEVTLVLELNLSDHGVITPKALAFVDDDTVLVAGSGSGRAARVTLSSGAVSMVASLPGVVALVPTADGFIGASPLLDVWVVVDGSGARAAPVPVAQRERSGARTVDSKLGEALVFTTIMAPRQRSEGALSRFTCEACHFEGTIDGRIHDTGRMSSSDHVRATTKPLWGLFNNKPLFTRAMDPSLARMAHAEFRVANANSALDPWFALTPADAPWLSLLGVEGTRSPIELRRALVAFLRDFTPRANPRVARRLAESTGERAVFSDVERRGAEAFRARCVSCHGARLIGDDPATEQPFDKWETLVLSDNGPLVWSSAGRTKTGVLPYVHEEGARASSLRRVWLKSPLFTNGRASSIEDALALARVDGETFLHISKRDLPGIGDDEREALLAFLLLL
jgi:hypothetical protein